ncbi:2-C-methyl-D-erythritol 4-phosphate cytidylyltransferase [bioreactor metagenome]|uniref:2-C-methyl-D-erythritol 4-phosphate cytidylyltransferase n=1 Tax=bioreactor metagenome TaxID=1076179 RepID=A0A645FND1_9ZZZZ
MLVSVIIVAAGNGRRMGNVKKQFLELCGVPVVAYSIKKFNSLDIVDDIILVTSKEDILFCKNIVKKYGFNKISSVICGGDTRCESVFCGIKSVASNCDLVAIHDAARPLIKEEDIRAVINEALESNAAVLAVNSKDTVKISDSNNNVYQTPARNRVWQIQTPQVFRYDLIAKAYGAIKDSFDNFTDDASVAEHFGINVKIVPGSYDNIKITTQEDMNIAEFLIKKQFG